MEGTLDSDVKVTYRVLVTNDPTRPSMVEAAMALLRGEPKSEAEVLALLQPGNVEASKARETIKVARRLGLIVESDGTLSLKEPGGSRRLILDGVFGSKVEAFGLESVFYAWLAAYEGEHVDAIDLLSRIAVFNKHMQLDGDRGMNETKLRAFPDWADYCGLGYALGGKIGFVCDPTQALDRLLPELLGDTDHPIEAEDFVTRVGRALPVLDRGECHSLVLRGDARVRLSAAASRALAALHESKRIRMIAAQDAPSAVQLSRLTPGSFDRVSQVARGQA